MGCSAEIHTFTTLKFRDMVEDRAERLLEPGSQKDFYTSTLCLLEMAVMLHPRKKLSA